VFAEERHGKAATLLIDAFLPTANSFALFLVRLLGECRLDKKVSQSSKKNWAFNPG
jgi:hypothetical protein